MYESVDLRGGSVEKLRCREEVTEQSCGVEEKIIMYARYFVVA